MIKFIVLALMATVSGCGCDADVGGVGGDFHCVQTRVDVNGRKYQYIEPNCNPDVDDSADMAKVSPTNTTATDGDMATTPYVPDNCLPPIDYNPLWVPCDMSTPVNPVADMTTDTSVDMTTTPTDDLGNTSTPDMTTPVTHDGACLSEELSYMETICHIPPGDPASLHTICIGFAAWPAHQNHGDYLGACVGGT